MGLFNQSSATVIFSSVHCTTDTFFMCQKPHFCSHCWNKGGFRAVLWTSSVSVFFKVIDFKMLGGSSKWVIAHTRSAKMCRSIAPPVKETCFFYFWLNHLDGSYWFCLFFLLHGNRKSNVIHILKQKICMNMGKCSLISSYKVPCD